MILVGWSTVSPNSWRLMVAMSFLASVARSGPTRLMIPAAAWYALQFGPLTVAILYLLTRKNTAMRQIDWAIVVFLGVYALCALVTVATGLLPRQTLEQSGLLIFMFAFLALTFSRRWATSDTIRGDLVLGFALICAAQVVGLAGMATGQAWPIGVYGRFQGPFSDANYAGILSAAGIMIGVYIMGTARDQRRWWPIAVGLLVLGVAFVLSGARGALLGLGLGFLSQVLVRASRRVILGVAIVGTALAGIVLVAVPKLVPPLGGAFSRTLQGSDITSGRLKIYGEVLSRWSHMPWFGTGYRTTELLTGGFSGHNVYLSVLAETGILGAAVFAALLFFILRAGPRSGRQKWLVGAVVTVLTIELTESTLFGWGGPNAMLAWLTLLAFAALGRIAAASAMSANRLEPTGGAHTPALARLRTFANRFSQ